MPIILEERVEVIYGKEGVVVSWPLSYEVDRVALSKFAEEFQKQFGNKYGTGRDGEKYDSCK